ncbi:TonB-dependent receptor [Novosphingobium sp.]|uniref:TonB-dependent receptor n=1 Tax=Novosphingobium sp. TaxID=1874826 RepID=UPI0025D6162C|nr:TonB-dependent receptor [Novosphingobium sp.]MCC6925350.1 TonB-dependent receptor [Novosphingobium sp.]
MIRYSCRSTASFAALAASLLMAGTAHAAVKVTDDRVTVDAAAGDADAAAEPATSSPEDAGSETRDPGLTEIVVTATKRETNLQKTPISISVMGAEMIRERKVQSLLDLGDGSIPSLRVATYESRQTALTVGIRGIVPGDANQPAREPGVGVYIDGIYLARQHGLNAALFEVDRIEVLKGPQGTLFGRNTEGGAVSLISKAPTGEFGGRMNVGVGNIGSYNAGLHLNLPEVAGFALKLDTVISHQDPTVKNPLQGQAGWNQYHRYGGRLAARWKPMDGFTADLAFDISRDENTPFYSQLINFNPDGFPVATLAQIQANGNQLPAGMIAPLPSMVVVTGDRMDVADIGVPQQVSLGKTKGFSSNLRWKVADGLELRSITAWRTVDSEQWDNSGGAHRSPSFLPSQSFSRYSLSFLNARQFSQEFQAVGGLGNVDYVFGLYYFNERAEEVAATPNTNQWNSTGTGYTIRDAMTWQRSALSISRASYANSKSYAAFGQMTWHAGDSLHLTLGGRYTHDEKSGDLYKVNNVASAFPFAFKYNRFDPLAVLAWDASDNINLYAKYSTGYRAGGASSRSISYATFGPENVKAYEIGAKTEFFDRRVRFNLAGYIMDRFDSQFDFDFYQVQTNGSVRHTLETVNAAGVTKIRGLEADLTVRPVEGLSMGLSYSYTWWKVPPTPNPLVTGNPLQPLFLVYTPPHAFSGNMDYTLPLSGDNGMALKFHVDANYSDPHYSFDNEPVLVDKSFLVNARLAVADIPMSSGGQKLTVSLWSRNLFNEQHIYRRSNANRQPIDGNYRAVVGDYANFNAPRTFGVEATLSF